MATADLPLLPLSPPFLVTANVHRHKTDVKASFASQKMNRTDPTN